MLDTLYNAIIEDYRHYEADRETHSQAYVQQLLDRILAARKNYPEYSKSQKMLMPDLADMGNDKRRQELCKKHWIRDQWDFGQSGLLPDIDLVEPLPLPATTLRQERVKGKVLSNYIRQSSDAVLMADLQQLSEYQINGQYYSDAECATAAAVDPIASTLEKNKAHTQALAKQSVVMGLRYHLHLLEEQLGAMTKRQNEKLEANAASKSTLKNSPIELVTAPSSDEPVDIWYGLAENPQTPYRFLVWLTEHHNPYVSNRALRTLKKFQQASRQQLRSV